MISRPILYPQWSRQTVGHRNWTTHAVLDSGPSWEYGVARGGLNRRIMESPPGVNRENDLRPHSPLAREDLKPLGSEWSLTYVKYNGWICVILTKSTRHTLVKLLQIPIGLNLSCML